MESAARNPKGFTALTILAVSVISLSVSLHSFASSDYRMLHNFAWLVLQLLRPALSTLCQLAPFHDCVWALLFWAPAPL